MASILKEIRRHCLEWGKKKGTCKGCPFHRMTNCLLREVPAEWDLDTIQKEFRYIKEVNYHGDKPRGFKPESRSR